MASVKNKITISFNSIITLSEIELRALKALVGYGDDAFIKTFKEKLGSYYIENYTEGLISFFGAVREQVLPALYEIDSARKAIAKDK